MPRRLTPTEHERFLSGRHIAVLSTLGEDGWSVLTPIWYLYRDGLLRMRTGGDSVKARNVRHDPRVTVCVQDERPPYRSVTVYGRASIERERPELAADIARHYLGFVGGTAYLRMARGDVEQSEEITIVVRPERVVTQDWSPETPLVGRAWVWMKRILPPWL